MFRKSIIITALCASSLSLSGCSTLQTMLDSTNFMVKDIYETTKSAFLRGPSDKSDVTFVEAETPGEAEVYKTAVGEYTPANPQTMQVEIFDTPLASMGDSVTVPCPEGTYLTAENSCMSLDTETFDFTSDDLANDVNAQFVDTSPVPCPEGTYLTAENTCQYLEAESFAFTDDVNMTEQFVDTSPASCPEGTYLNADNVCMFLEIEDFAAELNADDQMQNSNAFEFVQTSNSERTASP